jgi:hypothetical protein
VNATETNVERRLTAAFSAGTIAMCETLTHQPLERRATMRKVLISLAAAAATLAVAAPASAQVYGNLSPYGYGYGTPSYSYGYNGYGYNNVGRWQSQLQQVRYEMQNLARQGRLTRAEARDLDRDLRSAERSLYRSGRNGIAPWEARSMDQRIARLQYEVRRYADYDYGRYNGRRYGDRDWDHDRD